MRKLLSVMTGICLVFLLNAGVLAAEKTVYLEFTDEKDVDSYGPTIGIDWNINPKWTVGAGYQFEGDGNEATLSLGAEYALLEDLALGLGYDSADTEDSVCIELTGSYGLNDFWAITGGIAYTDYSVEGDDDYEEVESAVGVEYRAGEALLMALSYVLTDPSAGDSEDKWVIGAEYGFADYDYTVYFEYEVPEEGNTLTLGVAYGF